MKVVLKKKVRLTPAPPAQPPKRALDHTLGWTAEQIQGLRDGLAQGLSAAQIAPQVGKSRNAVLGLIHRQPELKALQSRRRDWPGAASSPASGILPSARLKSTRDVLAYNKAAQAIRVPAEALFDQGLGIADVAARLSIPHDHAGEISKHMNRKPLTARCVADHSIIQNIKTRKRLAQDVQAQAAAAAVGGVNKRFADCKSTSSTRPCCPIKPSHHCRFPIEQETGPYRYCGLSKREGSSYCEHHDARCNDPSARHRAAQRRAAGTPGHIRMPHLLPFSVAR